jgi:hypothetical protein
MRCLKNLFAVVVVAVGSYAQGPGAGHFGCSVGESNFYSDPGLKLVQFIETARIQEWQKRPAVRFQGFSEKNNGFTGINFFRWHVPIKGHKGRHKDFNRDAEERLALAIELISLKGETRWFELQEPADSHISDSLLRIQPDIGSNASDEPNDEEQSDPTTQPVSSRPQPMDEMSKWLVVERATPDPSVPLFLLAFAYSDGGANASGSIETQLMLDARDGVPKIARALQCVTWEGGGACGAPDYASQTHTGMMCSWEKSANDFACALIGDFGEGYGPRSAQKDFYLISGKQAKPEWQTPGTPLDLAQWSAQLHASETVPTVAKIPGLGKTTLLKRYSDMARATEVMVFASPAETSSYGERLWLAAVSQDGKATVRRIPLWVISGEELKEGNAGPLYTPLDVDEKFVTDELEHRAGFRALQVTATITSESIHVLYWIGLETQPDGALVANAVRVASEASQYSHCGQELSDGTAVSLIRKPEVAEATLRIRPQDRNSVDTGPDDATPASCIATSVLHWKPGSGFRIRKVAEDCKASVPNVKITDDGKISATVAAKD